MPLACLGVFAIAVNHTCRPGTRLQWTRTDNGPETGLTCTGGPTLLENGEVDEQT